MSSVTLRCRVSLKLAGINAKPMGSCARLGSLACNSYRLGSLYPTLNLSSDPGRRHYSSSSSSPPQRKEKDSENPARMASICFKPNASAPDPVTKEDRPSLNAADKFFRQRYGFLYSASEFNNHTTNEIIPEIVILGRSNVGKSTFLNALVGRSTAAKVSRKAGHTSTMNVFGIGTPEFINKDLLIKGMRPPRHGLRLLDTPGYGYGSHVNWGDTIVKYLHKRKALRGAVLLFNRPGEPHEADRKVMETLAQANCKTLVVLTKADTLGLDWAQKMGQSAELLRPELRTLSEMQENGWKEGPGWVSDIYAIAAGSRSSGKSLGQGGGIPGVRRAIMDMAGYNLEEKIEVKPETINYDGDVVSFDDIQWKT